MQQQSEGIFINCYIVSLSSSSSSLSEQMVCSSIYRRCTLSLRRSFSQNPRSPVEMIRIRREKQSRTNKENDPESISKQSQNNSETSGKQSRMRFIMDFCFVLWKQSSYSYSSSSSPPPPPPPPPHPCPSPSS